MSEERTVIGEVVDNDGNLGFRVSVNRSEEIPVAIDPCVVLDIGIGILGEERREIRATVALFPHEAEALQQLLNGALEALPTEKPF